MSSVRVRPISNGNTFTSFISDNFARKKSWELRQCQTLPLSQVVRHRILIPAFVGSKPTGAANTTWTPQVGSVSGIVVWVLGSPERSLTSLDVLLRRKVVPSKARF